MNQVELREMSIKQVYEMQMRCFAVVARNSRITWQDMPLSVR